MRSEYRLEEKLSLECRYLLKCVRNQTDIDMVHTKKKQWNWDRFLNYAIHHRLYPVLYPIIKRSNVDFPKTIMAALEERYQANTFKMLYFTSEMERLSVRFFQQKLHVLFLKGPILAELYGDLSLRTSSDLDALVPINELSKMDQLLKEEGFIREEPLPTILNDWKWRQHHTVYKHEESGMKFEVHWRLHPGPGKEISFNTLWANKRLHSQLNGHVYCLGYEDLFVFLIIHGARHGWFRLRWLLDIHHMLHMDLNWELVCAHIKQYYHPAVAGQALFLTSEMFRTKIPEKLTHLMNRKAERLSRTVLYYLEDLVDPHSEPLPREISVYNRRYLFSLMSFKKKCVVMMGYLYPYPEDARTLKLPRKLHYLYFLLRPFLWVWRKTRRVASI
ncbi:nucleotidyltransferase family protein [Halalkalibacter sp. AB-rgal2]|uniref:nucleotidyltransferase domain-containing protein n=1 Tax=Halalkalibacter sp. AB-rgal2 TaxID=3242695 RepID=UPI00359D77A1